MKGKPVTYAEPNLSLFLTPDYQNQSTGCCTNHIALLEPIFQCRREKKEQALKQSCNNIVAGSYNHVVTTDADTKTTWRKS